jgi:hypothetical protein
MYSAIRASAFRLIEKSRIFVDVLSGFDDPHGDDLSRLEARVHHLEAEVKTLRSVLGKPGVTSVSERRGVIAAAAVDVCAITARIDEPQSVWRAQGQHQGSL